MVYDKVIRGKFVDMRSITLEDTEFSYNIRADEKHRDIVGQLATSVEEQYKFIEWQMKQPDDYYFVVLNKKGEKIGLTGVYNIDGEMGEVGREVNYGDPMQTTEAGILLEEFCRDILHLKKTCCVIYTNNKKNLSNQKKKGNIPLKIINRNGMECAYYETEIGGMFYKRAKRLLDKIGVEQSE